MGWQGFPRWEHTVYPKTSSSHPARSAKRELIPAALLHHVLTDDLAASAIPPQPMSKNGVILLLGRLADREMGLPEANKNALAGLNPLRHPSFATKKVRTPYINLTIGGKKILRNTGDIERIVRMAGTRQPPVTRTIRMSLPLSRRVSSSTGRTPDRFVLDLPRTTVACAFPLSRAWTLR